MMIAYLPDRRMPAMHSFVVALFGLAALVTQSLPAAAQNGPCQRITNACKSAGFIYNSNVPGTGLVIDCIQPIAQNKPQPANAKIPLPKINPQVLDACLAANPSFGQPAAAAAGPDVEEFPVDGESYGWYDDGWSGPGWYIVGSEFRRGVGFGGREGWHGLKHRGSHPHNAGNRPRQGGTPHRAGGGQRQGRPQHAGRPQHFAPHRRAASRRASAPRHFGGGGRPHRAAPHRSGGGRHAGGGGRRGGGGGRRGGGGGRHRSDIRLKHDIVMLGHLDNGLGFYRFSYNGSDKAYVGVMAQEVQAVMPQAVVRGRDGYLLVDYDRVGVRMETWDAWVASGQKVPSQRH
jgi:endosialidase-like protein